eukprot:2431093-Lingulodinium_polyedra.AAC.1
MIASSALPRLGGEPPGGGVVARFGPLGGEGGRLSHAGRPRPIFGSAGAGAAPAPGTGPTEAPGATGGGAAYAGSPLPPAPAAC